MHFTVDIRSAYRQSEFVFLESLSKDQRKLTFLLIIILYFKHAYRTLPDSITIHCSSSDRITSGLHRQVLCIWTPKQTILKLKASLQTHWCYWIDTKSREITCKYLFFIRCPFFFQEALIKLLFLSCMIGRIVIQKYWIL